MKVRPYIFLLFFLFTWFLTSCYEKKPPTPLLQKKVNTAIVTDNKIEIPHKINVLHKGISLTEPVACTLIEVKNDKKQPIAYYMNVKSVVCGDKRCRVDLIKIFWDILGGYSHVELPDGVDLEKDEGENFTNDDYTKLNIILSDADSPLQNVYKHEIVSTIGSEGIDALTGATILVDKSSYVEGAVWTCYSIWHWIHGDTKQILRNITGDSFSELQLKDYLKSNKKEQQLFALEQLTIRKDFSKETMTLVSEIIQKKPYLVKPSIPYLNNTTNSFFRKTMQTLIINSNTKNRLLCFNEILKTKQPLSTSFFESLDLNYSSLTFEEVHLLLKIFIAKKLTTNSIKNKLIELLKSKHFLTARRVYWFLKNQKLTKEQEKILHQFYKANQERM
ncbi:hypothetical protein [Tenacibaculum agarivorans]|uniref:hypothetical protein n=1 Tax=Tenacibaculum agarivorans TaxID=1908389 RepID=UPI000A6C898A|nr:hypothetical protein [Tenacibaculum agarivorans]